ncbi:MAG TPA: hypothetical protein OIM39_00505 [Bacteroidaceae bacterium]|nr:hypothetical protein [Bacteroidaceae bacterium]
MKIDKAFLTGLLIVIAPFVIIYEIVKSAYNCLPHKIAERKKLNEEIKELEAKLGKTSAEKNNYNTFDAYYFFNPLKYSRKEYFKILRQKARENYKAPDIIVAAENSFGSICCPMFNEEDDYEVLFLADSEIYRRTENTINAKEYLDKRKLLLKATCDFHWFFYTLQECPDYSKYNVVDTGIRMRFKDIKDSELVKEYIEEFRKNNLIKE